MIMIEINTSDFLRMPSSIITFSFLTGSVAFSLGSLSSGISRIMLSSLGSRVNTGGEGIFSIFYKNRIWITSHDFCDICHGRLLKKLILQVYMYCFCRYKIISCQYNYLSIPDDVIFPSLVQKVLILNGEYRVPGLFFLTLVLTVGAFNTNIFT